MQKKKGSQVDPKLISFLRKWPTMGISMHLLTQIKIALHLNFDDY